MNVILIGYRGCGKTTVGQRLADRLWQTFADVDDLIVRRAGKTIKQIFEQDGEAHFRDLETAALREALAMTDKVIGVGGGIVVREENRKLIKESGLKVIYLKCEPAVLEKRIREDPATTQTRPPLTPHGGNLEEILQRLAEREPLYRQLMTAELEVTNLTMDEAVHHISRMI